MVQLESVGFSDFWLPCKTSYTKKNPATRKILMAGQNNEINNMNETLKHLLSQVAFTP